MLYSPSARSRKASYAVSNLSWSEATDEASKMVHSESVEELSDTPDQPLSASDPLSSLATMSRSTLLRCRNHHLWIQAVQDHFDDVPLCVPCCQLLRFVCVTAPQHGCKVYLATPEGSYHAGALIVSVISLFILPCLLHGMSVGVLLQC